jgi:hypothetical protein
MGSEPWQALLFESVSEYGSPVARVDLKMAMGTRFLIPRGEFFHEGMGMEQN